MIRWLIIAPALAFTLPAGLQGQASLESSQNQLSVTVGEKAHLKWDSFSIDRNETVRFIQPSANSIAINHVIGGEMSSILGKLNANGTLYLVNPSGIFVGKEALIDVGSFIASTLSGIGDKVESRYDLKDSKGTIQIEGKIVARNGDAILASHRIECGGEIVAEKGSAILAAGQEVIIQPGHKARAFVKAVGGQRLTSDGNLYSLAINQEGIIDGEIIIAGQIVAKETALSANRVTLFGKIDSPKIDCSAAESIHATGLWSGKEIALRSRGSLNLGRIDLGEEGALTLQTRQMNLDKIGLQVADWLAKGKVTLCADAIDIGEIGACKEVFSSDSSHALRLEGGEITIYEGLSLERDLEILASDLIIGPGDHGSGAPLTIESKEGKITIDADRVYLFDGREKTALYAREIAIKSRGVEVIAEAAGCDVHADEILSVEGAHHFVLDANGNGSTITWRGKAVAFKGIETSAILAQGAHSRIQVRAESALGLSGGASQSLAQGLGAEIEWSAPRMALRLDSFEMSASAAQSQAKLTSGALELITDKTITLAASGEKSLTQITLTAGGRNFILAGEDLIFRGSLGEVQLVDLGADVGLALYAGRDLLIDSMVTIEINRGDCLMEAGRDLILRDQPRLIAQMKEAPSWQLLGRAVGKRRVEPISLGEFFKQIADHEIDESLAFASFASQLGHPVPQTPMNPIELFAVKELDFFDTGDLIPCDDFYFEDSIAVLREYVAHHRRSVEHILCQSMKDLGLQGKLAASIRRKQLQESQSQEPKLSKKSPPWKMRAENIEESTEVDRPLDLSP